MYIFKMTGIIKYSSSNYVNDYRICEHFYNIDNKECDTTNNEVRQLDYYKNQSVSSNALKSIKQFKGTNKTW